MKKELTILALSVLITTFLVNAINAQNLYLTKENFTSYNVDREMVRAIYNIKTKKYSGTPEQIARQYLIDNKIKFRMKNDLIDLKAEEIDKAPGGTHILFTQTYKDIPVFGSKTIVSLNKYNDVCFITTSYKPDIKVRTDPQISGHQAINLAKNAVKCTEDKNQFPTRTKLIIYEDSEKNHNLAWKVYLAPFSQEEEWYVFVNAITGTIHKIETIGKDYITGSGSVFEPDPGSAKFDSTLTDQSDSSYPAVDTLYKTVDLNNLKCQISSYSPVGIS